jgi:hypothetical protein
VRRTRQRHGVERGVGEEINRKEKYRPLLDPWEWIARDDLGSQEIWRVAS